MSRMKSNARLLMVALGFAVGLPIAMSLTANAASASGYLVATDRSGTTCLPNGGGDCPDGGEVL